MNAEVKPEVLIAVAHGSESLETVTLVNLLRRAGLATTLASVEPERWIKGTRGIDFAADCLLADVRAREFALIVLPGGEAGAEALARSALLVAMLKAQDAARRHIAAICAAPALVLAAHGLLDQRRATGYPAFRTRMPQWIDEAIVDDGHVHTSQGPATALPFALALIGLLAGPATRAEVAKALLAE